MTDKILETIGESIHEIERQLLAEFDRIRSTESTEAYSTIDRGVRNALDELVRQLWHDLEHSGDVNNLSLRTDRHEDMSVRLIVLKKLLDAKIPTALLHDNHQKAAKTQATSSPQTARTKKPVTDPDADGDRKGLLGSIKGMFGGNKEEPRAHPASTPSATSNHASNDRVSVYLDKGVYAAAQQLASLAGHFDSGGDDKELMDAAVSGKASFQSRELSTAALSSRQVKEKSKPAAATGAPSKFESRELSQQPPESRQGVAQTPEEIRKKLEQSGTTASGTSRFEAKEVKSAVAQPLPAKTPGADAPTPEAIRKNWRRQPISPPVHPCLNHANSREAKCPGKPVTHHGNPRNPRQIHRKKFAANSKNSSRRNPAVRRRLQLKILNPWRLSKPLPKSLQRKSHPPTRR